MKSYELRELINQIKKYELTKEFNNLKEFEEWISKLNRKQIKNFNNLIINPEEIIFPKKLLINENLLNCDNYNKRVKAMCKLKNGENCWHLFDKLCSPNFLRSKNYYQDIDIISKADNARYALCVISDDTFINSKYHEEDLRLIVEAKDTVYEGKKQADWLVREALATVACNQDSINSPYHQKDMQLIATIGSEHLQINEEKPLHSINNLAINKVSLKDHYHLQNMQILAKSPISSNYLYKIMTDKDIIKGKYYRAEVEALANAKSKITAIAIYLFIVNPKNTDFNLSKEIYDCDCNFEFNNLILLNRRRNIKGYKNSNYLDYLKELNKIDDNIILFIESLMSNKDSIKSFSQYNNLKLLLTINDKKMFLDLYLLMINKHSLEGFYHTSATKLISNANDKRIRALLLHKATDKFSIKNKNYSFDMEYIAKLKLDKIDKYTFNEMRYYLFDHNGITHFDHINRLEKLYKGEFVEPHDPVLEYLNNLEQNPDSSSTSKIKKMLLKK